MKVAVHPPQHRQLLHTPGKKFVVATSIDPVVVTNFLWSDLTGERSLVLAGIPYLAGIF